MKRTFGAAALSTALAALVASAPAKAADEDFFKGKTITIYIGFSPGGTYDLFGRMVARFIGKQIPGNPTVVASNMPGAGSFTASNWLYRIAPKDGTALGAGLLWRRFERKASVDSVKLDRIKTKSYPALIEATKKWKSMIGA
mgnify:CR=1 FL=1